MDFSVFHMNVDMDEHEFPHGNVFKQEMVDDMGFFFQGGKSNPVFTKIEVSNLDLFAEADIGGCFVKYWGLNCCLKLRKFLIHAMLMEQKAGKKHQHKKNPGCKG